MVENIIPALRPFPLLQPSQTISEENHDLSLYMGNEEAESYNQPVLGLGQDRILGHVTNEKLVVPSELFDNPKSIHCILLLISASLFPSTLLAHYSS